MNAPRYFFVTVLALTLAACRQTPKVAEAAESHVAQAPAAVPIKKHIVADSVANDSFNYANYYVIVADTGLNYPKLNQQMKGLAQSLHMQIDTLGRYYNEKEDLISLPKDDEDEIYAGEYFPRRQVSESLSLEYLNYYSEKAGQKTIALVTGMYADPKGADSAFVALKRFNPKAFKLYSKVYIGCMH